MKLFNVVMLCLNVFWNLLFQYSEPSPLWRLEVTMIIVGIFINIYQGVCIHRKNWWIEKPFEWGDFHWFSNPIIASQLSSYKSYWISSQNYQHKFAIEINCSSCKLLRSTFKTISGPYQGYLSIQILGTTFLIFKTKSVHFLRFINFKVYFLKVFMFKCLFFKQFSDPFLDHCVK